MMQNTCKLTETLTHGYSSKSTQQELSNKYQHDRVWMIFKNILVFVLCTKVASALEGLNTYTTTCSAIPALFQEYPMYLQSRQFQPFLQGYANEFDLMRHIRLNTQVVKVSKSDDYVTTGRWTVTSRQLTPDSESYTPLHLNTLSPYKLHMKQRLRVNHSVLIKWLKTTCIRILLNSIMPSQDIQIALKDRFFIMKSNVILGKILGKSLVRIKLSLITRKDEWRIFECSIHKVD